MQATLSDFSIIKAFVHYGMILQSDKKYNKLI